MEELNEMLAELASDGALDSSGVFTVSLDKAEEKLAAYRLTSPGLFVLNLVAAAVSAGASRLAVETRESETSFAFDPDLEYKADELKELFTFILKPSAPAHLRELALALHGTLALPDAPSISLTVAHIQGGHRLCVKEGEVTLHPMPKAPRGVKLSLVFPRAGGWAALFSQQSSRSQEILQHLFHFCRFAPLKLTNNGQLKNSPVRLGGSEIFAWRLIRGTQRMTIAEPHGNYPLPDTAEALAVPSTILVGLGSVKSAETNGLLLISRGVIFKRRHEVLGVPTACAVVSADHLEKNLSQSDLVEDGAYEALVAAVRGEISRLVLDVCAQPPQWANSAQLAAFKRALDYLFPSEQSVPTVVETFRRLAAVEVHCRDLQAQSEQMDYWRSLREKSPEQAADFAKSLAPAVGRLAGRRLTQANWGEAASYLTDLYELEGKRKDSFLGVVHVLADQEEKARPILTAGWPDEHSATIRRLLGWSNEPCRDTRLDRYLQLQSAIDGQAFEKADTLADALQESKGTAILYLWLGWYHVFRERYSRALTLWEKALQSLHLDERERWSDILWPVLSGNVSFLEQIRWQARRSLESVQFSFAPSEKPAAAQTKSMHPAHWAEHIWQLRLKGEIEAARQHFTRGYLAAMIKPNTLTLEPLESRSLRLAPFR